MTRRRNKLFNDSMVKIIQGFRNKVREGLTYTCRNCCKQRFTLGLGLDLDLDDLQKKFQSGELNIIAEGYMAEDASGDYKCTKNPTKCKKIFKTKTGLEIHVKNYHEQVKPLVCNVGGKLSLNEERLKAHITTHTNPTDISCEFCPDEMFDSIHRLKAHQQAKHVPATCNNCGKQFDTGEKNRKHRKTCLKKKQTSATVDDDLTE